MIQKASHQPILLDTHAWIWLMENDPRLRKVKARLEENVLFSTLFVSTISIWEIAMIESKKRVRFPISCLDWLRKGVHAPGITIQQITPEIAVESVNLSGLHADPADRILVATAKILNAQFLTHDKQIQAYSKKGHLEVLFV